MTLHLPQPMRPTMPAFVTFGRVLFAVLFLYSGATKLFAVAPTADFIAAKVAIPALLAPYTAQLETMTGMPTPQLLAIAVGVFEIVSGLMIALNFGARFFAILLIFFVAAATFYFHDFWNQSPPDNAKSLMDALKNLSIIGALFIIAGYGRSARSAIVPAYGDV
jgi:putative oxidoreductase